MKNYAPYLLMLSLSGCASISYEPVKLDSASPVDAANVHACPVTLDVNKVCIAKVQADRWTSPTGIEVKEAGEAYCLKVLPDQVWFDANRRHTPPYGEVGSWVMRLSERRHLDPFFSLMIDVEPEGALHNGKTAKVVPDLNRFRFPSAHGGKLVLYPNDAKGPANDPAYWYKNNHGYIWVIIERCI